jgi:hypothetical protein
MPKGSKHEHGYATTKDYDGGIDYRQIAKQMTSAGYKMNHSSVRGIFMGALAKIAKPIHDLYGVSVDSNAIAKTAKDPRFQSGVADILESINKRR